MKPYHLLVYALVGGCAAPNQYDVDETFTPEEQQLILHAAEDWTIATKEPINLTFGVRTYGHMYGTREIIKATSRTYHNYSSTDKGDIGFTLVGPFGVNIVLVVDRIAKQGPPNCPPGVPCDPYPTTFRRTIQHEFGHALGIVEHTTQPGSIMYAYNMGVDPYECIDSITLDSYCNYKGDSCDRSQLVGCALPDQYVAPPICEGGEVWNVFACVPR